jgi:hypothetical protein
MKSHFNHCQYFANSKLLLIGFIYLASCHPLSPTEKELHGTINKTLHLDMLETVQQGNNLLPFDHIRQQHKHISVVYLQNGCRPCYPKFIEWHSRMDSIATPNDYTVLFVIHGVKYEDFMINVLDLDYVDARYYVAMDPDNKFLSENKEIPRWMMDGSLLIDSENKIKMVGAPWANKEMTALFQSIVNEQ